MAKTASYTRAAIDKYNDKFDRVTVNLPKGAKETIKETTGKSPASWCKDILIEKLKELESNQE